MRQLVALSEGAMAPISQAGWAQFPLGLWRAASSLQAGGARSHSHLAAEFECRSPASPLPPSVAAFVHPSSAPSTRRSTGPRAWGYRGHSGTTGAASTPSTGEVDTIYALASAPGRSGVAVLRLSGPQADGALRHLLGGGRELPNARHATLRRLRHPRDGTVLDTAVVLRFPGPASFTGDDVVELHVHGSPAVVRALLGVLGQLPGLRMAQAGEFARRAFLAGKMDLLQLESTADLLAAETEAQRRQARPTRATPGQEGTHGSLQTLYGKLGCYCGNCGSVVVVVVVVVVAPPGRWAPFHISWAAPNVPQMWSRTQAVAGLEGGPGSVYRSWRGDILHCLASVEAVLDFGEDADLGSSIASDVRSRAVTLRQSIQRELENGKRGEIIRDGVRAVLLGPPNVGKSSILNLLAGRPAAIVTSQPGTTRDIVEVPLELNGLKVILSDTAGFREDAGDIEQEGINRATHAARLADVLVAVLDVSTLLRTGQDDGETFASQLEDVLRERSSAPLLVLLNKSDLLGFAESTLGGGEGAEESSIITRHRHRQLLRSCVSALLRYESCWEELELATEELRCAARALGSITGAIETEEVLDAIFSEFCIGK
eukprot:jgi/Tetstr1/454764/TSEL_041647.t1